MDCESMAALLDLDQLRTFVAIAESGSFTRAADMVFRTQSAVSMQMRRLEERVGKPLFTRDGRNSRLSEEGVKLLGYARKMLRLNDETLAVFDDAALSGHVRLGTPDDYADRFLPEILARFARSNPQVEVTVVCAPTPVLADHLKSNQLDLAIITYMPDQRPAEMIRREPLYWVTSSRHHQHEEGVLPLALGRATCEWRRSAIAALERNGQTHRVLYSSWNSTAVGATVLAGLAVAVLPESAIRPGMRILTEAEGFPELPSCNIGLLRSWHHWTPLMDALACHISESLGNVTVDETLAIANPLSAAE